MATVRFLALSEANIREGIMAIQLADNWHLVVFYSVARCLEAMREAGVSSDEMNYWRPRLVQGRLTTDETRPNLSFEGTAASFVGLLLAQLNGRMIPIQVGTEEGSLVIFRVPAPGTEATDGMMGVKGNGESYTVFYSKEQAIQLLEQHRYWLGAEVYGQHRAAVDASPLPATSTTSPVELTGYPAWLINFMLAQYEQARLKQEAARKAAN